jgi:phospholipid/cholesterol/gamma-HCH transport system ATP-binding protein
LNGDRTANLTAEQVLSEKGAPAILLDHVSLAFDEKVILRDVSFTLLTGHTKILLGASGAGKSLTLKIILGLLRADGGAVWVNGHRVDQMSELEMMGVRADVGMVFQEGALFDSLTVRENVGYRLYEETKMPLDQIEQRVREVLGFIGLGEFIDRMPSALSGGQRRRVAIARAMASKPKILLYDEPTTGLDPITATTVDDEIIKLRDLERVTSVFVTHQIRDAFYIATHRARMDGTEVRIEEADAAKAAEVLFMVLHEGRIHFEGTAAELLAARDQYVKEFMFMTLPPW